jgi:hypothetical protein
MKFLLTNLTVRLVAVPDGSLANTDDGLSRAVKVESDAPVIQAGNTNHPSNASKPV